MNFNKPLFSDSGGFQAFSLGLAREHNIGKIGNFFPEESKSWKESGGISNPLARGRRRGEEKPGKDYQ